MENFEQLISDFVANLDALLVMSTTKKLILDIRGPLVIPALVEIMAWHRIGMMVS